MIMVCYIEQGEFDGDGVSQVQLRRGEFIRG